MTVRFFYQTLSFVAHEFLNLVDDTGATPCDDDAALGLGSRLTAELFGDLVRHGLLQQAGHTLAPSLRQDLKSSPKDLGASPGAAEEDSRVCHPQKVVTHQHSES